jgi:ABC-type polysaccharide/polyol phosphate export permease
MLNETFSAASTRRSRPPDSRASKAARDIVEGLERWELWTTLGWHDVRQRYRRSLIGPFWLTLNMGVLVGTLGFLYSGLWGQSIRTYLPHLALGFMVWGLISSLMLDGCNVFISSAGVIRQLKSPLSTHVFRMVWRNLIIFGHNFLVYLIVALLLDIRPGPAALLAVPGLTVLCLNGIWAGILFGLLSARFRDIPTIMTNIVQVLFFLTPIIWTADQAPDRAILVQLNPFYHLVEIVRAPLLGAIPPWTSWIAVLAVTLIGYASMMGFYIRFRARIAYWV